MDVAKLSARVCLQRLVLHFRCFDMLRHAPRAARLAAADMRNALAGAIRRAPCSG